MSNSILKYLGLEAVTDEETLHIVYGDTTVKRPEEHLQKWMLLLPENIKTQIDAALEQKRPFLPPDVTPEMMAVKNNKVPSMNQMEVLYRCVDFAFQAADFKMAATLVYVVDRATYWSNASKALLQVVDLIKQADPKVAIAPQVQVRKARVLKDEGNLHGAMKVLDEILVKPQDRPGEWKYGDNDQYLTTKAEIIKIKGHILYNMGLLKEAVELFLESQRLFESLHNKDDKGIASCLSLLSKCLGKLSLEEFGEVQKKFPDAFKQDHPCFESYVQGLEAFERIKSLQESLYSSRHLLDADSSLLKYAILSPSLSEEYKWLQTILQETKRSLGAHKTVNVLRSSEQFFEFIRGLFMISLTLEFSPVAKDRKVSNYIEQICLELYLHLCNNDKVHRVARLEHSPKSVSLINVSLALLCLPKLVEADEEELFEAESEVVGVVKHTADESREVKLKCDSKQPTQPVNTSTTLPKTSPVAASYTTHEFSLIDSSKDNSSEIENRQNYELRKNTTFRGWTYNFGHKTREEEIHQSRRTLPLINSGKPLDPKKQWQTYKYKCVGLPVDPNLFAYPVPSHMNTCESDVNAVSSSDEKNEVPLPLVNLSVPRIKQTVENRTKTKETTDQANIGSLVNREITTVSSTGFEDSDRISLHPHDLVNQPMRGKRDKRQVKEDVDASTLSPLIDLAEKTIVDLLQVNLGESTSTQDPVEYMEKWRPPSHQEPHQGDVKIQRAYLLNFNPITEVWTGQSTLAFLGDELDLSVDEKGNCRDAFHVQFLHQDEPRGRYVGKRYRPKNEGEESNERNHHPRRYMQDVVCQMMAGYYVTRFNEAMQNYERDIKIQFLPGAHLQLLTPNGDLEDCINVEPYLHGDFIKLTNNFDFADKKYEKKGLHVATALTHFSYCESKGTLMIVDIQGWLPKESSGVIYLTDPQFHTIGLEKFSPYDYQEKGMEKFWKTVHPKCNDICQAIGLERSIS